MQSKSNLLKSALAIALIAQIILGNRANAQLSSLNSYQEFSHLYYKKQQDSLKKNWKCPSLFTSKEAQKIYKENWEARTAFITTAMANRAYVFEAEVHRYISGIIAELAKGNPEIAPQHPLVLIDRSAAVNAYAVGGDIIAVNLGLLNYAKDREEIALVLAHELSHNYLRHAENAMQDKAEWLSSEEYKSSIKSVLDSKYGRLTKLKKILETFSFDRSRHQRYHETEADSLAVTMLKNSKISFNANYFLRLDSVDNYYQTPLKQPVKSFFDRYGLSYELAWEKKQIKGLSARNYNFKDTSATSHDSLKTHPDCVQRYEALKAKTDMTKPTPIPASVKDKVGKMLLWNIYDDGRMTACLYRIMLIKEKGNNDPWYDFMFYNVMAGLAYADQKLNRFNAISVKPKEHVSKAYFDLQTALEQMPREILTHQYDKMQSLAFWQQLNPDEKAVKTMFENVLHAENDEAKRSSAANSFSQQYSNSIYCELADHLKK